MDGHYLPGGAARAAAVVAANATFSCLLADRTGQVAEVPSYQSGQFCLRELPPLHAVLDGPGGVTLLIVDGYADLDPGGRPGLGAQAHAEFGVPVIGVAKTAFRRATHAVPVVRGESSARPLYVTAAGMSRHRAADLVRHMAGRSRLPDALRRADSLARGARPDHDTLSADALIAGMSGHCAVRIYPAQLRRALRTTRALPTPIPSCAVSAWRGGQPALGVARPVTLPRRAGLYMPRTDSRGG